MSSSFFGLTIASSGMNAFQAAINTTANNISNVSTKGYSKQVTNLESTSALRMFQKYGSVSTGVTAASVTQARDRYYDDKYWNNQSSYGFYTTKYYYMQQIEDIYTDSATTEGFTKLFTGMFNSLDRIQSDAEDQSVRTDFFSDSEKLALFFNGTSTTLQDMQSSLNDEIKATVDTINSISQKITALNKQINVIEMSGGAANELRDSRALLVDELSEIVAIDVREDEVEDPKHPDMYTGATTFTIKLNGQPLVDTFEYNVLETVTREKRDNQMDIDGLYDIRWAKTGLGVKMYGNNQIGSLRALFEMRDGNDQMNLTGSVEDATSMSIKVKNPSITSVDKMNMPENGTITIKNVDYAYSSFTAEVDDDGNITSFTFQLENAITSERQEQIKGLSASVGDSVDFKGIPYYQNEMNTFLRSFARAFNDVEKSGEDLYGNAGQAFFVADDKVLNKELGFDAAQTGTTIGDASDSYYRLTAANISVSSAVKRDPKLFAAKDPTLVGSSDSTSGAKSDTGVADGSLVRKLADLQSNVKLYRGGGANSFLESIYADVTVDTRESSMFNDYYSSIQETIDRQRKSISGVDEDEEAMDLVKFQNAYNLSSKVISVLAEMYDRLILNTGV